MYPTHKQMLLNRLQSSTDCCKAKPGAILEQLIRLNPLPVKKELSDNGITPGREHLSLLPKSNKVYSDQELAPVTSILKEAMNMTSTLLAELQAPKTHESLK